MPNDARVGRLHEDFADARSGLTYFQPQLPDRLRSQIRLRLFAALDGLKISDLAHLIDPSEWIHGEHATPCQDRSGGNAPTERRLAQCSLSRLAPSSPHEISSSPFQRAVSETYAEAPSVPSMNPKASTAFSLRLPWSCPAWHWLIPQLLIDLDKSHHIVSSFVLLSRSDPARI